MCLGRAWRAARCTAILPLRGSPEREGRKPGATRTAATGGNGLPRLCAAAATAAGLPASRSTAIRARGIARLTHRDFTDLPPWPTACTGYGVHFLRAKFMTAQRPVLKIVDRLVRGRSEPAGRAWRIRWSCSWRSSRQASSPPRAIPTTAGQSCVRPAPCADPNAAPCTRPLQQQTKASRPRGALQRRRPCLTCAIYCSRPKLVRPPPTIRAWEGSCSARNR
jgi:hypothetical protein